MSLDRGCYRGLDVTPFHCCNLWSAALAAAEGRVAHRGPVAAARFAGLFAKIFLCNAYAAALPGVHRHCQHLGNKDVGR